MNDRTVKKSVSEKLNKVDITSALFNQVTQEAQHLSVMSQAHCRYGVSP